MALSARPKADCVLFEFLISVDHVSRADQSVSRCWKRVSTFHSWSRRMPRRGATPVFERLGGNSSKY